METKVLIDTDVLIYLLRGDENFASLVQRIKNTSELATTDINAFELYHGAYRSRNTNSNLRAAEKLLASLELVSTDKKSMATAGKLIANLEKKGKTIDIADLFIASICLTNSFTLLTKNTKHFEDIEDLKLFKL